MLVIVYVCFCFTFVFPPSPKCFNSLELGTCTIYYSVLSPKASQLRTDTTEINCGTTDTEWLQVWISSQGFLAFNASASSSIDTPYTPFSAEVSKPNGCQAQSADVEWCPHAAKQRDELASLGTFEDCGRLWVGFGLWNVQDACQKVLQMM